MNVSPGFATANAGGFGPQTERSTVSFCDKCSSDDRATCTGYRQFSTIALACSCQCHSGVCVLAPKESADSDVANRFLDCWNEERERRLTAEREEYLTRRMMDFAWSIALPGVARRDRGVVESILAAARLEKHNSLARVVAAARALASGDASAAAELRLAVAALDADPQVDLPSPADGPLPPRAPLPLTPGVSAAPDSGGEDR